MADGSVTIKIKGDDSDFSSKLSGIGGKAKSLLSIAAKGAVAATAALAGLAGAAIKVGSEFEAEMSKVASISGASASEMAQLTEKAKEMGATTKFSAREAGEAMEYMAMAGWKTEDMLSGIDGIMNLAAASGADLATTSDIVTDALTAFGLQASDAGHFADVLATASSNANTNVEMMGATFKYAAPIAGALGYSIEDTAVAIGLMANAGIKGEQAGTSLRMALTRLADPPAEAASALESLGVSATNADGSMRPLNELITDLRAGFANLSEAEKTSAASAIAGTNAMSGFLAIMNASESDFQSLTAAINNADGAAASMAETMQDNLQGQLTILKSGLEGLGIAVYDKLEAPLKQAAKTAIQSVNEISQSMTSGNLSASMDKLAAGIGNVMEMAAKLAGAALPALINGFALIAGHAQELVIILSTVGGAFAAMKIAPIVAEAAAGFTALVASAKTVTVGILAMSTGMKTVATATHLATAGFTAYETVVGVATGRISLATAAQYAWNTALAANPIGLVIAAVAALIGVVALLTVAMGDEASAAEETADKISDLNGRLEEEKKQREELAQARQESIAASMSEIDYTQNQITELQSLIDANGKVKEGYEARAQVLADSINSVIPGAVSLTQQEGAAYVQLAEDIQQVIEMKRLEAAIEAGKEAYTQAIQEQSSALERLAEAARNNTQAQQDLADAQARYNEAEASGTGLRNQYAAELKSAEQNARDAAAGLREAKTAYDEIQGTIAAHEGLLEAAASGDAAAVQAALDQITYGIQSTTATTESELQAQIAQYDSYITLLQQMMAEGYDNVSQSQIDGLIRMRDEAKAKLGEVGEAMDDGLAEGINGNAGVVADAMSNTAQGAVDSAGGVSLNMNPVGVDFSSEYGSGIDSGKPNVLNIAKALAMGAVQSAQTGGSGFGSTGTGHAGQYGAGLSAGQGGVNSAAQGLGSGAVGALNASASQARAPGQLTATQFGAGITAGKASSDSAARATASSAKAQFQTLPGTMPGIGQQVGSGLASGILSMAARVASAAASLVTRAIAAAKAAAAIASPSKKMRNEVGKMMTMGLALGLTDEIPTAKKHAERVVDAVSALMTDKMQQLNDDLAELQRREDERKAEEELDRYEENIRKKNEEIEKAETKDKERLQRELTRMQDEWLDKQKEATLKSQQETLKEQQKIIEDWQKSYEEAIEVVTKKQETMAKKISEYGDLYSVEDDKMKLTDLEKQVRQLEKYGNILDKLKSREVSDSLMNEILSMDIDTAVQYGQKLLSLNEEKFAGYIDAWNRQQQMAKDIAARYYQEELDAVESAYSDKLDAALKELPEEMQQVGRDAISGWIQGLNSKQGDLYDTVRRIAARMVAAMQSELDIHSPSKKTATLVGAPMAAGIEEGFTAAMKKYTERMKYAVSAENMRVAANLMAQSGQQALTGGRETQTIYQTTTTDRTPVIEFKGSLAGLAKALLPALKVEEKRIGATVIQGGDRR